MRTAFVVVLAFGFAISGIMWGMSGADAYFGQGGGATQLQDSFNSTANKSSAGRESFKSDTRSEGGIIGFVIRGTSQIGAIVSVATGLPDAMRSFGFPNYIAAPVGRLIQLLITIGIVQFITGRVYR